MKRLVPLLSLLLAVCLPVYAADEAPSAAANAAYLAANAARPGTVVRPSGLQYRVLHSGFGRRAAPDDVVRIAYTIRLINGKVADHTSSNLPAALAVSSAGMAGLSEALKLMHEGDRWELVVPSNLALGARGTGNGMVPPDQTLVFDLTLLSATTPRPGDAPPENPLSLWGYNNMQGAALTIHP